MNAEAKVMTPRQCLEAMRPELELMLADVQGLLEGYPMDTRTRGDLGCIKFHLKMILED